MAPVASAHGANTFQFIMRNGSIQPDDVQVTENDSLIFNNVVMDSERTIELQNPNNSNHSWSCTAQSYNSTGNDDECQLWLDPLNWSAGNYQALVYSDPNPSTFQFIMRDVSIQPDVAQVTENDSLIFTNVVMDSERTIELQNPNNSNHSWSCTAQSYNSTGNDDECQLWLDPLNWSAGNYQAFVYSNGSTIGTVNLTIVLDTPPYLWQTVNLTIILDTHNETTPNFVLPSGNDGNEDSKISIDNMTFFWIGLVLFGLVAISRTLKKGRLIGDK